MSQTFPDTPRHTRWTLAIACLLLLALLLLWFAGRGPGSGVACCAAGASGDLATASAVDGTTPAAPDAAMPAPIDMPPADAPVAAPATAGEFAANAANGTITLTGVVADEAARARAVDAARAAYGADRVVDRLRIQADTAARPWEAAFADIFAWQRKVPDAGIAFDGTRWVLTGTVTSEAEKRERGEQAAKLLGADAVIDNQIKVVAVADADDAIQCGDRMAVAVNFASGSSVLNAEAKAMLDRVYACLKDGSFEIAGHTDNTGAAAANQSLSLARAESAKAYLVSKGASAQSLTAAGYGPDRPIADNGTAEGKAKNRRIEFSKR